jgi:transposase
MTRNYNHINDTMRRRLITLVQQGLQIKQAAAELGINYENAKAIVRVFKNEDRTTKRVKRNRKSKKTRKEKDASMSDKQAGAANAISPNTEDMEVDHLDNDQSMEEQKVSEDHLSYMWVCRDT